MPRYQLLGTAAIHLSQPAMFIDSLTLWRMQEDHLKRSLPVILLTVVGMSKKLHQLSIIFSMVQEYNFRKRMEHAMKRTVVDGKTISVVDPRQYAKRFRTSMTETFVSKT